MSSEAERVKHCGVGPLWQTQAYVLFKSVLNTGYRTNMEITIEGGWSVYVSKFHAVDCIREAILETIKLIAKRAIR